MNRCDSILCTSLVAKQMMAMFILLHCELQMHTPDGARVHPHDLARRSQSRLVIHEGHLHNVSAMVFLGQLP